MNIILTLDKVTLDALSRAGIPAEGFAERAVRAHLRTCQDAAHVLRAMDGPPQRSEERWATELADREPAVRALLAVKG